MAAAGSFSFLSLLVDESSNRRANNNVSHRFRDMIPRNIGRPVPVSYTHLDVYKRQVIYSAE